MTIASPRADTPVLEGAATDRPRILVIDRDRPSQRLIKAVLTLEGYTVATVADTAAALRLLTSTRPDLLIVDDESSGPIMNALTHGPWQIPVLLLTIMDDGCRWAARAGIAACHQKPYDLGDLVATVRRLCAARAPSAGVTAAD
jgi:two-component system KDP operon response regulator KdpE